MYCNASGPNILRERSMFKLLTHGRNYNTDFIFHPLHFSLCWLCTCAYDLRANNGMSRITISSANWGPVPFCWGSGGAHRHSGD